MIQGKALKPSVTIEAAYRREIMVVVRAMQKSVARDLANATKADAMDARNASFASHSPWRGALRFKISVEERRRQYDEILERLGKVAAMRWMDKQIKYASRSFLSSVRSLVEETGASPTIALKGSIVSSENVGFIEQSISENVALIKSVGEKYFDRIEKAVLGSMNGTLSEKNLKAELKKIGGMSDRQADLIARDQTSKVYSQLAVEEMKRAGITKVKWIHSSAGKNPRTYHQTKWDGVSEPPNGLDGYIYDINNPPIADLKTGERAIAGQLINCRCFNVQVLDV